jgi:hypothetical protein
LALLAYTLLARLYWNFVVDDVYISLRYVRQWVEGNGLVYNVGERVEGYSNFLWIVLLGPLGYLGFDLYLSAKWVGFLLGCVTLFLVWWGARRTPLALLPTLLLAVSAPFVAWSVSGLETSLYTLLVTAGVLLFVREEESGRGWLSAVMLVLAALARPEGLMFAGLAILFRAWQLYRSRRRPQCNDWVRLGIVVVVMAGYSGWRLWYYGYPLPNTVYAKSMGFHPRGLLEGIYYLYQNLVVVGGLAIVAFPIFTGLARRPVPVGFLFPTLCLGLNAIFTVLSGGDWMPLQRFAVPMLPLFYLVVQAGTAKWSVATYARRPNLLLASLLAGQIAYMLMGSFVYRFLMVPSQFQARDVPDAAIAYLQANVDPEFDVVAVVDAGQIAYTLPIETHVLDMVGLVDEHIAHLPPRFPGGLTGRGDGFGKWDVDYVLARHPRFVQVHLYGQDDAGNWRSDFTGASLLVNDPRFQAAYQKVTTPGVQNLFERIDQPPES